MIGGGTPEPPLRSPRMDARHRSGQIVGVWPAQSPGMSFMNRAASRTAASGPRSDALPVERTPANNVRTRRVLLVDDSKAYRRALRLVIESLGNVEVVEAGSGEEALSLLPEVLPQIVFMDINLPGISGIETTSRVLDAAPAVVVIGLSIYTDDQSRDAILKAGALTLLNKEGGISTVLALVEQHI